MAAASTRPLESSATPAADVGSTSGVTCLHNGNVYRHKERFTSTSIGLKPDHPNQCVQCACEVSVVFLDFYIRCPIERQVVECIDERRILV